MKVPKIIFKVQVKTSISNSNKFCCEVLRNGSCWGLEEMVCNQGIVYIFAQSYSDVEEILQGATILSIENVGVGYGY